MNWLYNIIWILFQLIAPMDGESQDIVPVDPGNYTNSFHWIYSTCFPDNESLYC